ncbi:hypothetical protein SLA2020_366590 [Shorea laevis]
MTTKPWLLFVLLLILSFYRACFSIARDTLSPGQSLSLRDTLLSQGGTFELGFFIPGTPLKIYLGICERYFTYSLIILLTLLNIGLTKQDSPGHCVGVWPFHLEYSLVWTGNLSGVYALCGAFGVNYGNFSSPCECLTGFEPSSMEDIRLNDWSGGCVRKSPLQCENNRYANGKKDWFLKMLNMGMPVYSKAYLAMNASRCELACMENCSCTAYAYNRSGCMIWEGALLNLHQLSVGDETGQDIYLRLAAEKHQSTKGKKWKVWVVVLVPAIGLTLFLFICFSSKGKLKRTRQKASSNNLLLFDFDTELHAINDGMNTNNNMKKREKDTELPLFSYESVSAATTNFSTMNKLGEGGFGPVYKGNY